MFKWLVALCYFGIYFLIRFPSRSPSLCSLPCLSQWTAQWAAQSGRKLDFVFFKGTSRSVAATSLYSIRHDVSAHHDLRHSVRGSIIIVSCSTTVNSEQGNAYQKQHKRRHIKRLVLLIIRYGSGVQLLRSIQVRPIRLDVGDVGVKWPSWLSKPPCSVN